MIIMLILMVLKIIYILTREFAAKLYDLLCTMKAKKLNILCGNVANKCCYCCFCCLHINTINISRYFAIYISSKVVV